MNKIAKLFTLALCLTALASYVIASNQQPHFTKYRGFVSVSGVHHKNTHQQYRESHGALDEETEFTSTGAPVAIPDFPGNMVAKSLVVTQDLLIEDLNLTVNITHTYISDLILWLVSPSGDSIQLVEHVSAPAGANMINTVFDDEAANPFVFVAGGAPYTGTFRPLETFAFYDGLTTLGTWFLVAIDNEGVDVGTIDNFTLTITHDSGPTGTISGTVTVSGAGTPIAGVNVVVTDGPSTTTIANGTYSIELSTGTYTVNFTKEGYEPESVAGVVVTNGQVTDTDVAMTAIAVNESDFTSSAAPVAIPDLNGGMAAMALDVTEDLTITDLNLTINITHTYVSDLIFWLVSPAGDSVQLVNHVVAPAGANMTNTVFDDEAATAFAFTVGGAPYTGNFRPLEPFSILDGGSTLGTWYLVAVDNEAVDVGTIDDFTLHVSHALAIGDLPEGIPSAFALHGAYPNPFNPSTNIVFSLPITSDVQLSVFNSIGQEVATLVNGTMNAGSHTLAFNAANLPSGLYFAQLCAGSFMSTQKLVLMK